MNDNTSDNLKDAIGRTKPSMHLIPPVANIEEAVVMALGARKYGAFNWRGNRVAASVYISAAMRHLAQWMDGEDKDPESGASHLAHVRACMGILLDADSLGNMVDDRPPAGAAKRTIEAYTMKQHEETQAMPPEAPEETDDADLEDSGHGSWCMSNQKVKWYLHLREYGVRREVATVIALGTTFPDNVEFENAKFLYICGPMRGLPNHNFEAFDAMKNDLLLNGFTVISPADIDRAAGIPDDPDLANAQVEQDRYAERDLSAIRFMPRRDGAGPRLVALSGWENSSGSLAEIFTALWIGGEVFVADPAGGYVERLRSAKDVVRLLQEGTPDA